MAKSLSKEELLKAVKRVSARQPGFDEQERIREAMKQKEVERQTELDPEKQFKPKKILNVPEATYSDPERDIVSRVNDILTREADSKEEVLELIKEINVLYLDSQAVEHKISAIHRQALEQIEDRFNARLAPLQKKLRELNERV